MAGLYPLSRYQQFDENGELLVGARLFLFDGGTTTPRVGYRDSSLTTQHPNPIVADAAGRIPLIYLADGFYRQRLTTASGVVVFDDDGIPVLSTTVGGTGTSVDPLATFKTRDIKIRFDDQPLDGYVRLNGRTIGTAASGATERANGTPGASDVQALYEELWPFANITMGDGLVKGSSGPTDFIANRSLKLPDCAGRGIFGMDNMGAGARGVLTTAVVGTDPTLVGSYGGSQQVTIAKGNLPVYNLTGGASDNFTVSGESGVDAPDHAHHIDFNSQGSNVSLDHSHNYSEAFYTGGANRLFDSASVISFRTSNTGNVNGANPTLNHVHQVFGDTGGPLSNHKHSFTWTGFVSNITIGSGGSGTAITNLPPIMTFMIYIRL
jgi:hypothetical protein